jgi:intein/homing endonuclease
MSDPAKAHINEDIIVYRNRNPLNNRLLIGTPTRGLIRAEWAQARYGQVIPTNWMVANASVGFSHFIPIGYSVADAQNLIVQMLVQQNFEWCFKPETLVETITGAKYIRDVEVGDLVKTHTGKFRQVTRKFVRPYKQCSPLIWVKTGHSILRCTPNHPFFVRAENDIKTIEAKDLQEDNVLLYPATTSDDKIFFDVIFNTNGQRDDSLQGSKKNGDYLGEVHVTRQIARLLGLYLAEGCCKHDSIAFTFNNNELAYHSFIAEMAQILFRRKVTITRTWATQIKLSVRNLSKRFREWFGANAREKRVPDFVFGWNIIHKLEFLKGYLDGDGSYKKAGGISFGSASKDVTEGIIKLAQGCGLMLSRVYRIAPASHPYQGKTISNSGSYYAGLTTLSANKMLDLLDAPYNNGYLEIAIKGIEEHGVAASLLDENVYNLEVEEDNSYIAGSVAVHNCLFIEDDVVLPVDAFLRLNEYIKKGDIPVVSGLYYLKSNPSEPLVYRGRGNGPFTKFKMNTRVWADGVPTGVLLIHGSILKLMYSESKDYTTGSGSTAKQVFETPAKVWFDPEKLTVQQAMGTSDLYWCDRVMKENVLERAGWKGIARRKNPFLVDTNIKCLHIDLNTGIMYPLGGYKQ